MGSHLFIRFLSCMYAQSGDPVLVLYENTMALGYLTQPAPSATSMFCQNSNPIGKYSDVQYLLSLSRLHDDFSAFIFFFILL